MHLSGLECPKIIDSLGFTPDQLGELTTLLKPTHWIFALAGPWEMDKEKGSRKKR